MIDPLKIEKCIKTVHNQASFLQKLLADTLEWPIEEKVENLEDISYSWNADELRAQGLDKKITDGQILQIQPLAANQPWGIFLLEFRNPDVFTTGRGMTGPLRKVLRGLVPSRRRQSHLASWKRKNLLFVCTHNYEYYRFSYFKAPLGGTATAPLATFGWEPGIPARTACEFNLPALEWPENDISPEKWVASWAAAFDVEKVTKKFYEEYRNVFEQVEKTIQRAVKFEEETDLRMFTQTLFNRLMFLRFVERKGWLEFDGRRDYLSALHKAGNIGRQSFYLSRIRPLFFEGLAIEGNRSNDAVGDVPYLNGGLFEEGDLDRRVKDIPDEAFPPIIGSDGLFYHYNFTIEESTPLDIEVAVDPEMLGKVFEELVTGRHETGSYYTPRPIVWFMCREALKGYLDDKTSAPDKSIAALVDGHEVKGLTESHAREIIHALDNLNAVDPACGSGAYLLGLLHELVAIYRALQSEKLVHDPDFLYNLKLRIISRNLYGVDNDPFATNIAMLRLWLSLAVEADQPMPLPNLDFKIETGDALLSPNPQNIEELFFHVIKEHANKLVALKDRYLVARGEEKERSRHNIKHIEAKITARLDYHQETSVTNWSVNFAEVFVKNRGFDIVLANPPYIRQERIKEYKGKLKPVFPEVYSGTADIYCYFYARALQLLRPGGMMAYISSNKWFRANYGKNLRNYIAKNCRIHSITDFGDLRVFQSATSYPMIFVAQKGQEEHETVFTQVKTLDPPYPDVLGVIKQNGIKLPPDSISGPDWQLMGAATRSRLQKMKESGIPLREYVKGQIYRGVLTGFNKAFVITGARRKQLIDEDPKSAEIIKPLAIGRDIRKWHIDRQDRWLIVTKIGVDIEHYPAVFRHLQHWQKQLQQRQDQGNYWWELRACKYYAAFEKPKILYPEVANSPRFTLDTMGIYPIKTVFSIASDDLYLLAVLNSSAFIYYQRLKQNTVRGGYLMNSGIYLESSPIPESPAAERAAIEVLVRKCLDAKGVGCEEWEKEIDERVAALYGLIG